MDNQINNNNNNSSNSFGHINGEIEKESRSQQKLDLNMKHTLMWDQIKDPQGQTSSALATCRVSYLCKWIFPESLCRTVWICRTMWLLQHQGCAEEVSARGWHEEWSTRGDIWQKKKLSLQYVKDSFCNSPTSSQPTKLWDTWLTCQCSKTISMEPV